MAKKDVQFIGFDGGRGYIKAYTEVDGEAKQTIFKSVYGDGRSGKVDFENYEKPKYLNIEGEDYFVGLLAERESYSSIRNSQDSKTSDTMKILFASALNDIAVKDTVKVVFGVPYKNYKKSVLADIVNTYKGETITIKDNITNATKKIFIEDVTIAREGDAALYYAINGKVNKDKPVGLVNVGFRTMELSYFDKGFQFNDRLSNTVEYGNSTMLKIIQDNLMASGIAKSVNEIDSSDDYDLLKKKAYKLGSEKVNQIVEENWINKDEMKLYLAGGTSLNLEPSDDFDRVDNSQIATAIGLFKFAKLKF